MFLYFSLLFSSLGLGQTEADILEMSCVGTELSPSTSILPETDRCVSNTVEQPSLGAGVKPGTTFSETFRLSFFLFSIPLCLFSLAHSPSVRLPPLITSLLLFCRPPFHHFFSSSPSLSPLDLDVKASQAVWSLPAGCQGRDPAHWDPEWDKLTVTMFPLSMWSQEKEKVKKRA